jgi:hypothetical protein
MNQMETSKLEGDLEQAQSQFESEWSGTSDDNGARLIAAAIAAAGLRVQLGLLRLAAVNGGSAT